MLGIHLKMVQIPYLSYFLIVTSMIDGEILIYALVKFNYTFNQVLLQILPQSNRVQPNYYHHCFQKEKETNAIKFHPHL